MTHHRSRFALITSLLLPALSLGASEAQAAISLSSGPVPSGMEQVNVVGAATTSGDIDNDGDQDIIVLTVSGIFVLENTSSGGTMSFTRRTGVFGSTGNSPYDTLVLFDFDHDGDLDAVGTSEFSAPRLWENDLIQGPTSGRATAAFTFTEGASSHGIASYGGTTSGVAVLDVEGDGDLDIVFDTNNSALAGKRLYKNQLSDSSTASFSYDSSNPISNLGDGYASMISALDVDLDGDTDLQFRSSYNNNFKNDVLFRNITSGSTAAFDDVTETSFTGSATNDLDIPGGFIWGDFNRDGAPDFFVQNGSGSPSTTDHAYRANQDVNRTFTDINAGSLGVTLLSNDTDSDYGGGIALADLDNDGDLDLYWSTRNGGELYENQLSSSGTATYTSATSELPAALNDNGGEDVDGVVAGDFDNDGDVDIYLNVDTSGSSPDIILKNDLASGARANHLRVRATCEGRDCIGATIQVFDAGLPELSDSTADVAYGVPYAYRSGYPGHPTYPTLGTNVVASHFKGQHAIHGGMGTTGQQFIAHFGDISPSGRYVVRVVFPDGAVVLRDVVPNQASESYNGVTLSKFVTVDRDDDTDDGDGLTASEEASLGSDPQDLDSDDDGVSDYREVVTAGTDPANADTDGDGLKDGTELGFTTGVPDPDGGGVLKGTAGGSFTADADSGATTTDPTDPDTDGDGLCDGGPASAPAGCTGEEDSGNNGVYNAASDHSNPLDLDTDDDAVSDGEEVSEGTDPKDEDSDGDGLDDGLELGKSAGIAAPGGGIAGTAGTPATDDDPSTTTDPLNPDTDGDGLCDGNQDVGTICDRGEDRSEDGEVDVNETDPNEADTDGDGLDDGVELDPSIDSDPLDADSDDDGLSDGVEVNTHGTDPNDIDTDGDGLCDGILTDDFSGSPSCTLGEVGAGVGVTGTDPTDADSDNDSLSDYAEVITHETDPNDIDTDDDGLCDGVLTFSSTDCVRGEVGIGAGVTNTDPTKADSDGDTLTDGAEVLTHGTNPNNADTDGDGLADNIELGGNNNTDPTVADSDGDCIEDGDEDYDGDGNFDAGELNPNSTDTDGDGLPDASASASGNGEGPCTGLPYSAGSSLFTSNPVDSDTDDDGLSDGDEILVHGTDPKDGDSDDDGLSDSAEINTHSTDPNDSDSDNDGLSDGYEVNTSGTNPNNGDSDGDSLTDGQEINTYGTDPLDVDTDGDGLCDGRVAGGSADCTLGEQGPGTVTGTDPDDADSDDDGLSDGDEVITYNTNPNQADSDDDELSDFIEVTGDNPTDPNVADTDGDCIIDGDEDRNHDGAFDGGIGGELNPNSVDTDGDGVPDGSDDGDVVAEGPCTGKAYPTAAHFSDPTNPDTDGDGLTDGEELALGTEPRDSDTDGDGLSDGAEENTHGTNPTVADTDGDTLTDGAEINTHGTDALVQDTDGDGLRDDIEVDADCDLDPTDADTDGDGLCDGWGIAAAAAGDCSLGGTGPGADGRGEDKNNNCSVESGETDPLAADTDSDTLSDGAEELTHETNPLLADTDSDELNDNIELGGSNPTDPNDADSDNDCIIDGNEDYDHDGNFDGGIGGELNPNSADTDGDGINDGNISPGLDGEGPCSGVPYPTGQHVSDPTNPDTDGDGFTDFEELDSIGTDPRDADSDNDGLSDYEEAGPGGSGTDPNDSDSDDDGLSDGVEVNDTETNPLSGDTDGDGVADGIEADPDCPMDADDYDSDNDGLCDGPGGPASDNGLCSLGGTGLDADGRGEDRDADCIVDASETDPTAADSDGDGLNDRVEEETHETSPIDADSDDDGLSDFIELVGVNPGAANINHTDPLDDDSDDDCILDGDEDYDGDGAFDGGVGGELNPNDADTDGDGLADGADEPGPDGEGPCSGVPFETDDHVSDPTNPDTDGDTLSDYDEVVTHGSDPTLADTDGDGLDDPTEVNVTHTDPSDADSDDDELTDREEVEDTGTDPNLFDSDADGLGDGAELSNTEEGTDPLDADSDDDGILDGVEVTNCPLDANNPDTDGDTICDGPAVVEGVCDMGSEGPGAEGLGEDADADCRVDSTETNPNNPDTDGDGVPDNVEEDQDTSPIGEDTDGDGLSDHVEQTVWGSDPNNPDTDGDGLGDGAEVDHPTESTLPTLADTDGDGIDDFTEVQPLCALNATSADTDGDGLCDGPGGAASDAGTCSLGGDGPGADGSGEDANANCQRDTAETDGRFADTDGDGLSDGDEELIHRTNPIVADSDSDNLSDGVEINDTGTDPNDPDTDDDGLSDGAEVSHGSEPTDPTLADTDGDGVRDDVEVNFACQLIATNPDSDGDGICDGNGATASAAGACSLGQAGPGADGQGEDADGDCVKDATETNGLASDTDGDGLSDLDEETVHGTSPISGDTDGDGLSDGAEISNEDEPTDPSLADTDGDGVGDAAEVDGCDLDANNPDTDGDGLCDGNGVTAAAAGLCSLGGTDIGADGRGEDRDGDCVVDSGETDPLDVDTDGDTLGDAQEELETLTSPVKADTDDDLLSDNVEINGANPDNPDNNPTDPNNSDTDGDCIVDGAEDRDLDGALDDGELNPNLADTDSDGLPDGSPVGVTGEGPCSGVPYPTGQHISDPTVADTDGDGLLDGEEYNDLGTDPEAADSDGDGLSDFDEVREHETNPLDEDTDGDLLSDGEEVQDHGTNPRLTDTDGDGLGDFTEVQDSCLTNPTDPDTDGDGLCDGSGGSAVDLGYCSVGAFGRGSEGRGEDANNNCILETGETDPTNPDTDYDTLSDGDEELIHESNPLDADTDDDLLEDGEEVNTYFTNPLDADSDDDGLGDGDEVQLYSTNPLDADTDDDLLCDGPLIVPTVCEIGGEVDDVGTDPNNPDTDGGCQGDGAEVRFGTDPFNANDDDCADLDGDGLSNSDEVIYGSDPEDADSDDDGVLDGAEACVGDLSAADPDGDLRPCYLDADSDDDGIPDGTEMGLTRPQSLDLTGDFAAFADSTDLSRCPHNEDGELAETELLILKGCPFWPDADPNTTTSPLLADTDGGGADDGAEDWNHDGAVDAELELDPNNSGDDPPIEVTESGCELGTAVQDVDCDGLTDDEEMYFNAYTVRVDPADADTDDDGVIDGREANWNLDTDGDGLTNVRDPDSDNDGVPDGIEAGVAGDAFSDDTDPTRGFVGPAGAYGDQDASTVTSMIAVDTDFDGADDGAEDPNHDGAVDSGERQPTVDDGAVAPIGESEVSDCYLDDETLFDADCDGLTDKEEVAFGTNPSDADSDDDSLIDSLEDNWSLAMVTGEAICALNEDCDGDKVFDSVERGRSGAARDTNVNAGNYQADGDSGATTTSMVDADSDGGGIDDGLEDTDGNGRVDEPDEGQLGAESDPNDPADDCADPDGDRICEELDNCPFTYNPEQLDFDNDGQGDACDTCAADPDDDIDEDGVCGDVDNCPETYNPTQLDFDGDLIGDLCDSDCDGDGLTNETEEGLGLEICDTDSDDDGISDAYEVADPDCFLVLPDDLPEQEEDGRCAPYDTDTDSDIDALETDSDNDGIPDEVEAQDGQNPVDSDGDGTPDYRDIDADNDTISDSDEAGSNPEEPRDTDNDGIPDYLDLDSDNDGLSDHCEDRDVGDGCSGYPGEGTGTNWISADNDEGGVPDGEEYDAGTDPRDARDDGIYMAGGGWLSCDSSGRSPGALPAWMLLMLGAALVRRRR